MVKTRSEIRNISTVSDLKQRARSTRQQECLTYYETLGEAIGKGEVKDYFIGQTMGGDEIEDDRLRLFIRLLHGFPLEEYVPENKEIPIVILLLGELDNSLSRAAYPGVSDALISDCTEEEAKGFMMARRALVCSYLTKLQTFREKVTLQEK